MRVRLRDILESRDIDNFHHQIQPCLYNHWFYLLRYLCIKSCYFGIELDKITSVQVIFVLDTVVSCYCIYYEYYLNRRYYVSIFLDFSNPPTHYVSINTVLNVSKSCHFWIPKPSPFADVKYGWSLSTRSTTKVVEIVATENISF